MFAPTRTACCGTCQDRSRMSRPHGCWTCGPSVLAAPSDSPTPNWTPRTPKSALLQNRKNGNVGAYLSTAWHIDTLEWFGNLDTSHNTILVTLFFDIFKDVVVLIFILKLVWGNLTVIIISNQVAMLRAYLTMFRRHNTSVAGPEVPTRLRPGTCIWTAGMMVVFLAPTLALCTISFLSPSCIPLRPAIACNIWCIYWFTPQRYIPIVEYRASLTPRVAGWVWHNQADISRSSCAGEGKETTIVTAQWATPRQRVKYTHFTLIVTNLNLFSVLYISWTANLVCGMKTQICPIVISQNMKSLQSQLPAMSPLHWSNKCISFFFVDHVVLTGGHKVTVQCGVDKY